MRFEWAGKRGRHVGRPRTEGAVVSRVEMLARTTDLSVRKIHAELANERGGEAGVSQSVVGRIVKEARSESLLLAESWPFRGIRADGAW